MSTLYRRGAWWSCRTGLRVAFIGAGLALCIARPAPALAESLPAGAAPRLVAPSNPSVAGARKMSIELRIEAPPGRFIAGGELPVLVELKNNGNAPVDVPQAALQDVFEYGLKSLDPAGRSYALSAQSLDYQRSDDTMPRRPVMLSPLAPGATRQYRSDLGLLETGGIATGRYRLTVSYASSAGRITSPPILVEVVAPKIRALSSVAATGGAARLGQVVLDASSEPVGTILQRESQDERPDDGALYTRVRVAPPARVTGVAVAAEGEPANGVRWTAWLEHAPDGPRLGALVAQEGTVFRQIPASAIIGAAAADLSPAGWQGNQESASFTAIAKTTDGRLQLVLAAFTASGKSGMRAVVLDGMVAPQHWLVRFHGAGAPLKLDLLSIEPAAKGWRLHQRSIDFGTGKASPPTVLLEQSDPFAAWAVEPVKGTGPDVVDVLQAAPGAPARMVYRRLSLGGGKPVDERTFATPVDAAGQPPKGWQLSPPAHPQRVAVVRHRDQIVGLDLAATNARGFVLDSRAQSATLLQLRAVGGRLWATWADADQGLRFAKVP